MKPTTPEEALRLVPKYIMLRPGVDVWRVGDEWHERGMTWTIHSANKNIGRLVDIPFAARRIPQEVREAMAKNILERVSKAETLAADKVLGADSWVDYYKANLPFESWASQGGNNA